MLEGLALRQRLERALALLVADTSALRELAQISDYDTFTFYRRSDLSNLNLAGQDLTGLNFEEADLSGTDLSGITFDAGAFNGSFLSPEFETLKDEFDAYLEDTLDDQLRETVYAFASFREKTLEESIARARLSYGQLAEASGLSTNTVRKARRSEVVALDSAAAISKAILSRFYANERMFVGHVDAGAQPMVKFLELLPNGGFKHVPRSRMLQVIEKSADLEKRRYPDGRPSYYWRQNPDSIEWQYEAVVQNRMVFFEVPEAAEPRLPLSRE